MIIPALFYHDYKIKTIDLKFTRILRLLTGMVLLLFSFFVTSCNNDDPALAKKPIAGKRNPINSSFGNFVSRLQSLPESERGAVVIQFIQDFPQTPVIEKESIVSLYWFGKAKQVMINGDLQSGWSVPDTMEIVHCGDDAFFHITYIVPRDARLDYQVIVDTSVTLDPRNPAITPSGYGPHSEIAMPGFNPDTVTRYRSDIPHGTVGSIWFTSRDTSIRDRKVKIYIPAGYQNLSNLPVLFVLDGFEAIDYMSYPTVLDNLIASQEIKPVLVVFIPPADRYSEFLGPLQDAFINAICDELVPAIDRKFKTACDPRKRGITGISAGGHLALLTVFSRPDKIQCGAGQSATLSNQLYDAFHSFLNQGKNQPTLRIYFDVGRYDLPGGTVKNLTFYQANEDFHLELEKAGIKHLFQVVNDGHEWANWRERTDDILCCFFQ